MSKFIIVGSFRSGTTLLNESLASHPALSVTFEAFHENSLAGNVLWRDSAPVPFSKGRDFLDYVLSVYDGFKVLYHQLPPPNPLWDYIFKKNIKIIHVVRENLAEIVVSFMLCHKSGVWQNRDGCEPFEETIVIDPVIMEEKIASIEKSCNEFSCLFPLVYTVYYENMIKSWEETIRSTCDFLEIDYFPLPQITKKRTNKLKAVLANFKDHQAYFKATPYAKYFETPRLVL